MESGHLKDHENKMKKQFAKPKIDKIREDFRVIIEVFEFFLTKLDNDEGSAKRKLDKVNEQLLHIKSMLKRNTEHADFLYSSYERRISEYEISFESLINSLCHQMNDMKNEIIDCVESCLKTTTAVAEENLELKVLLKREKEEAMHQQQSHNFAITEKNTILATCRKLEEQLERKNQQIEQLQKQGTVTLWNREKTKLVEEIKSNEKSLGKKVKELESEALESKERLQRRITELNDQVKFLKMEKELSGKVTYNRSNAGNHSPDDQNTIKQQLYRKDRALVMAEAELQKQQKYFIGFIHGLKSDFKIMLERQGICSQEKYSRDQKTFMNMLSRLYTAAKEGVLSDLKAKVPLHYQGVIQETLQHPLGKRLTRSMSQLDEEYIELQKSGCTSDPSLVKPTFIMWRDAKSLDSNTESRAFGLHPELIDKRTGVPLIQEAAKYFPEWSENEINDMFSQFRNFDQNKDNSLDTEELLRAIPDILGKMTTTEEIEEAMVEVDKDNSGTVDFYEFLTVARLITQQKGKSSIFKKKRLMALQKSPQVNSKVCTVQ